MLEPKIRSYNTTEYLSEPLAQINWLSLWQASGCDWSSSIKQDCLATLNQGDENEKQGAKDRDFGIILGGVLGILALLGVATFSQAQEISRSIQEVGQNSVEQVRFINQADQFMHSY